MGFLKQLVITISILLIGANAFALGMKKDSVVMLNGNYAVISSNTIDVTYNDEVTSISDAYQNDDFKKLKVMISRGQNFMPMIERIFEEEGVPSELKYLAFIESGFNTRACSRAGARGMWQFMKQTAINNGLKVNRFVDERLIPEKATRAAAGYFKKMFATYGNWQMVIAAYNCGEGALTAAIDRSNGSNDFWEVYHYLPRETRVYVPHFLGIMDAMNTYSAQNELSAYLATTKSDNRLINDYTASVSTAPMVAKSTSNQSENLPAESSSKASEIYNKEYFVYIIKSGDSLEKIAKSYPKNSVRLIKDNNNIVSNSDLSIGSTLLLEK